MKKYYGDGRTEEVRISSNGINITTYNRPTLYDKFYSYYCRFDNIKKLPKRYIINKEATILFWSDDKSDKTIVRRSKDDIYDKRLGFLTAYFQYHSGLSKNKANRYLDNLEEE